MLKAKEKIRIKVIRNGKVVQEVEGKGNTLTTYFRDRFANEVSATSDIIILQQISKLAFIGDLSYYGLYDIYTTDITYDTINMNISISKSLTADFSGTVTGIRLGVIENDVFITYTEVTLASSVSVASGDTLSVSYSATFSMSASNLSGLLSDASIDSSTMLAELVKRLAGASTTSYRIASIALEGNTEEGTPVSVSFTTSNDPTNKQVKVVNATIPQSFLLQRIRLRRSDNTTMILFTKATSSYLTGGSTFNLTITFG